MQESDSIIDEVRAIRDALAKQHDYDVVRIAEAIRQHQATSGRVYVRLSSRPPVVPELDAPEIESKCKSA